MRVSPARAFSQYLTARLGRWVEAGNSLRSGRSASSRSRLRDLILEPSTGETSVFSDFLGEMVGSICVPVCAVAFSCLQQAAEART